jgi:hypothetical protein
MTRRILLFLLLLVPPAIGQAQEEEARQAAGEPESPGIFPVSLLLEAAETAGEPLWRPDWPVELPPDAFRAQNRGAPFLSAEILIPPSDSQGDERAYRFSRDREGRVREFPFLMGRELVQAEFLYDGGSLAIVLRRLPDSGPLELEVLGWKASRPSLLRVLDGENYSFVFIQRKQRKAGGILEAWYDTEGRLFGAYDFALAPQARGDRIVSVKALGKEEDGEERRYYDSRGFVTGVSGPLGDFSVLYYLNDLPRYWDCRPAPSVGEGPAPPAGEEPASPASAAYSLNWDEESSLLLGLSSGPPALTDCRYEYTLDERGNWIERREIRMIRALGLLVPSRGVTIRRNLEYGEEE